MEGHEPGSDEPQRAPGPMEVLLMALGGCTGMDVVSILRKKRVAFDGVEVRIQGERAPEHPRRYTAIQLEYVVQGRDIPPKAVEDAARLSFEKYCSVAATLRGAAQLSYTVRIVDNGRLPAEPAAGASPHQGAGGGGP